jgi:hypothetical protein
MLIAEDFPGGGGLDMEAIPLEEAERALAALVADAP